MRRRRVIILVASLIATNAVLVGWLTKSVYDECTVSRVLACNKAGGRLRSLSIGFGPRVFTASEATDLIFYGAVCNYTCVSNSASQQ